MATVLSNSEIVTSIGVPNEVYTALKSGETSQFVQAANEFIPQLLNKLVYQRVNNMTFANPFKKFDSYPVPYGDGIENVFVDKTMGYEFGTDGTDPFKKHDNNVKTLYTKINYKMQYPLTIEYDVLRRAVFNEFGLNSLVNSLTESVGNAKSCDEYLAQIIALNNSDIYAKGFETLDGSGMTTQQIASLAMHTIQDVVTDFALPSIDNNKLGVLNATPKEKCLLIAKQSLLNSIDMDYLSGVFNLSKIDMVNHIIPVRSFMTVVNTKGGTLTPSAKGDDIDFVILDTRGFDNHVALDASGDIYNPKMRYWNYYTDLWKVFAYHYGYQARAFKITK